VGQSRVRYAVVGLVQGLEDANVALDDPRIELRAVCDIDPRKHALLTGATTVENEQGDPTGSPKHTEFIRVLSRFPEAKDVDYNANFYDVIRRDDIDAVVVVTPDVFHEEHTVAALEAGKYVLCTKPMALTMESAFAIAEAAQKHPGHYMLGLQMSYTPFSQTVQSLFDTGELGPFRQLRFDWHRRPWRLSHSKKHAAIDGVFLKEGTHWLDLFYRLNGHLPFQAIGGFSGLDVLKDQLDFEDNGVVIIEYGGFRVLHGFTYFRDSRHIADLLFVGERGTARGTFSRLNVETDAGERTIDIPDEVMPEGLVLQRGYRDMHEAFYQMITQGKEPHSNWQSGLENMLTCVVAQIAVAENRMVQRTEFSEFDWRIRYPEFA
jgi:predicted dehydrogenase